MKLTDLQKVVDLKEQYDKCEYNLKRSTYGDVAPCGGYLDLSGYTLNLSGCGVMEEVIAATHDILEAKMQSIKEELASLGVNVEEEL